MLVQTTQTTLPEQQLTPKQWQMVTDNYLLISKMAGKFKIPQAQFDDFQSAALAGLMRQNPHLSGSFDKFVMGGQYFCSDR